MQVLLNSPPIRAHLAEQLVTPLARRQISRQGFLVRTHERLMNVVQNIAHTEAALALVDLGYRLDGLDPARWVRRYVDRFLVIVFNATD